MSALLVLGSKPEPELPPEGAYDDVACANASGFSAARHGLRTPSYTVLSAILTSGIESGRQSLRALAGLQTDTVYYLPRPPKGRTAAGRLLNRWRSRSMRPAVMRARLREVAYHYRRFIDPGSAHYRGVFEALCDGDATVVAHIDRKHPSSGIVALALGMAQARYDRYILSGFSFELTHAYASNPEITQRGTRDSRHTDTDVAVIGYLARRHGNVFTTEPIVHARVGVPMLGG